MQVDMRAYLFQMFLDIVFFYAFYKVIENYKTTIKIRIVEIALMPLIFWLDITSEFSAYLLYMIFLYVLSYRFKFVPRAINLLLFADICLVTSSFITNAIRYPFIDQSVKQGWGPTLLTQTIKAFIMILIIVLLRKKINKLFDQKNFNLVMISLQLSLLAIFYLFLQFAHAIGIYDKFAIGTLVFAVTEVLILSGLFLLIYFRTQRQYQDRIEQQQLDNLKKYTEQLEQSQLELRKFRHDYKNMLLSLTELSHEGDLTAVNHYLDELQDYSNCELSKLTDYYQDIGNVQEDHLKGVLLSKLFAVKHQKINCHFECRVPVKELGINPFDLVRLMSITLDNAIEAVQSVPDGKITVMLYQASDNLNITVENTDSGRTNSLYELRQPGVTTKENHSGLGLSIVDDFRRKYPNMFIAQKHEREIFSIQIVIENHTGGK